MNLFLLLCFHLAWTSSAQEAFHFSRSSSSRHTLVSPAQEKIVSETLNRLGSEIYKERRAAGDDIRKLASTNRHLFNAIIERARGHTHLEVRRSGETLNSEVDSQQLFEARRQVPKDLLFQKGHEKEGKEWLQYLTTASKEMKNIRLGQETEPSASTSIEIHSDGTFSLLYEQWDNEVHTTTPHATVWEGQWRPHIPIGIISLGGIAELSFRPNPREPVLRFLRDIGRPGLRGIPLPLTIARTEMGYHTPHFSLHPNHTWLNDRD